MNIIEINVGVNKKNIVQTTDFELALIRASNYTCDQIKIKKEEINSGYCGLFTDYFQEIYLNKDYEVIHEIEPIEHFYIKHNNMFYDSSCMLGVKDKRKLPIFRKQSFFERILNYIRGK